MRFLKLVMCAATIAMAPLTAQADFTTQTSTLLPGSIVGADFPDSYGGDFAMLKLYETGNNAGNAHIVLWSDNGGHVQFDATRGTSSTSIDLSDHAGALASIGGTAFTKVGIGGLDWMGASEGFDLDAVSFSDVPEPQTYALLLGGLGMMVWLARRRGIK